MDRRTFIKLTAITGTSATLASCGVPEHQLIRFVPDEELVPGIAEWKPSVCPLCASGCGLNVRVMMADVDTTRDGQAGVVRMGVAKKLEGQEAHPISQGGLCARGQAAIQVTYHPDRLAQPIKRTGNRGAGTFEPIGWDEAIAELVGKLDALATAGNQKGAGVRHRRAPQPAARAARPVRRPSSARGAPVVYELFSDDLLRRANQMSFGFAQLPTFDLSNANYVIGFGADFLGTWNAPVAHSAAYGRMRRGRPGVRGAFVQVEARMTPTGASADEWVAANPGTEGVLALGIAHVILREKLRPADAGRAGALIDGWSAGLPAYAPDPVATVTGVSARRIERLAKEFAERAPAVAIVGGVPLAHTNGLFTALAVNALNQLAGAVGQKGGVSFTPQLSRPAVPAGGTLAQLAAASPQVLIVDEANPVFNAPKAWKVREAFEAVPFIVSFASFIDETSVLADLILPDHSFLEVWIDAAPESGSAQAVVSVAGPAMKPLFQTRATADVLLQVAGKLQKPIDLGAQTYDAFVKAALAPLGDAAWTAAQKQSGWWGELPKGAAGDRQRRPRRSPRPSGSRRPRSRVMRRSFPSTSCHTRPRRSSMARSRTCRGCRRCPTRSLPRCGAAGSRSIHRRRNVSASALGDIVEVASSVGALRAPAFLNPGLAPDIIAMPVGQGHATYTRYASGRGANPVELLAPVTHAETGTLAWAATRVKVARVGEPDGTLVLFSARGELRENPREGETR